MKKYNPSIKSQNRVIESPKALNSTIAKNPNVSFRAGVNTPADDPVDNTSANLGFIVNYIYSGGRIDSEVKNIEAQIKSSIKQREDIIRNLETQLNLAYENYIGIQKAKSELIELVEILKKQVKLQKHNW